MSKFISDYSLLLCVGVQVQVQVHPDLYVVIFSVALH